MTQIARACGVSLKTVSRVLNHPDQVSTATKERVRQAMEHYGFQVNLLAKGLRQNQTNIIIVFLDRHNGEYLNSWRNVMLRYLFRHASARGLKIMVAPTDSQSFLDDDTDGFYLLSSGIADGAVLFEYAEQDKRIEYFRRTGTSYVVLGQPREKDVPAVSLDNYDIGLTAGTFIKDNGYRKVCFFTNEEQYYSTQQRVRGLLEMVPDARIYYGIRDVQCAYEQACRLFDETVPDCIFTNGDNRFMGIYRAAIERNIRIPEDLSVLSSDNLPVNEAAYPSVSSLKQDFDAIAGNCIELLQKLLYGDGPAGEIQIFEPSVVIERESTKSKKRGEQ